MRERSYRVPHVPHNAVGGGSTILTSVTPHRQTHPRIRAGTPTTNANAGTSWVTTAPAPTKAHRPTELPHTIVLFAPSVAPRPTTVGANSLFREISLRGFTTLVNTTDGPQNTSSSRTTPVYRTRCSEPGRCFR